MSEPTKDDLLKRLADARAEWDTATMGLIWLELGELLTALEAREDQAAAALREATEALTGPEAGLAAIDEETAATDRERLARLASAEDLSLDADKRGLARAQLGEWEADLTRLRQKRDWAEAAMQPLVQARDQARMVLAQIQGAKRGVMWAQLNPFTSPVAQATKAYIGHRQPFLNLVLLKNDRSDPEWEAAISEVEECCLRSAYRTDHLPSEAEQMARAMTASMADATSEPPPPAPSGRDVMKAYEIEAENHRLNNTRNRIDDYRGPAPLRSAPARDYMSVDRVPDHARQVPGRLDLHTLTTGSRAELQLNSGLRGGPARATRHRG